MLTCVGKLGETLAIDDKFYVTIVGVKDNRVLLCFDEPQKICIYRKRVSSPSDSLEIASENNT